MESQYQLDQNSYIVDLLVNKLEADKFIELYKGNFIDFKIEKRLNSANNSKDYKTSFKKNTKNPFDTFNRKGEMLDLVTSLPIDQMRLFDKLNKPNQKRRKVSIISLIYILYNYSITTNYNKSKARSTSINEYSTLQPRSQVKLNINAAGAPSRIYFDLKESLFSLSNDYVYNLEDSNISSFLKDTIKNSISLNLNTSNTTRAIDSITDPIIVNDASRTSSLGVDTIDKMKIDIEKKKEKEQNIDNNIRSSIENNTTINDENTRDDTNN